MMNNNPGDKVISQYLDALNRALEDLPGSNRRSILQDIEEHIRIGRERLTQDDEASVRQLLEELGDPEAIRQEAGPVAKQSSRWDAWVPWLLLFGGFAFGIGWLVGLIMLWRSMVFTLRDKLLGTLVWPGGLFGAFIFLGAPTGTSSCTSTPTGQTHCVATGFHFPLALGLPMFGIAVILPILVAILLFRRLARHRA